MTKRLVVDEFGNTWLNVRPPTRRHISEAECLLDIKFDPDLTALLLSFAGGKPERYFFPEPEVGVGRILSLTEEPPAMGLVDRNLTLRASRGLPCQYISFALDNGGANDICVRPDGAIVYWMDDVEDREIYVSSSLEQFISGLELFE